MNAVPVLRIAIVEDEKKYIDQLTEFVKRFGAEKGCAVGARVFQDGEDITESYRPEFDIILMDIQMRFMDGMTAARLIRERDSQVIIIFITSMAGYAIAGYEVRAFDYILKPVTYDMFSQKLARAAEHIRPADTHYIVLSDKDGQIKLDAANVLYVESSGHQMVYHTGSGVYSVRGRLDDLEKELIPAGFFRINRGYLVNLYHVTAIRDKCCVVAGDNLSISRSRKAELMDALAKIL